MASILGYTETLLGHPTIDDDTRRQFVERTHAQALRLTALLQDISTLNRMDYASDMLSRELVDVSQIVADIADETALDFRQRQMTLRNCLPEDIMIRGNASLIYSIFRNLLDNAVNYAGEGTTVELSATDYGTTWQFTVTDNGVGVADVHLPRLFERFYRIDKGRSRSMGGTGLGLAIVKNAVILHGGSITVTSDNGLTFVFSLVKG